MFLVDGPYVSDFFKKTVRDHKIPVVGTPIVKSLNLYDGTNIISEDKAVELVKQKKTTPIYCVSENSISWITDRLTFTELPQKIEIFKDKLRFRRLIKTLFPEFYFREIRAEELKDLDLKDLPLPFIIKPSVGFMSIGVYKISDYSQYKKAVKSIEKEIASARALYPRVVLDTNKFIIEQYIHGDEFAVDAYYDSLGEVRILNIFHHIFSSQDDVKDRLYVSSKRIIEENIESFSLLLKRIGQLANLKTFPVHIEIRKDSKGGIIPLEVNPMRFGGWCTTADMTFVSYGFNPYLYYYYQKSPEWGKILRDKDKKIYALIVLDNSTGIPGEKIKSFDYRKLMSKFEKPLELRKIDYKKYPLFAILFTETREENFRELKEILTSDLHEFIYT